MRRVGRGHSDRAARDPSSIERARSGRRPGRLGGRVQNFEWQGDLRQTGLSISFAGELDSAVVRAIWPDLERTVSIGRTLVVLDLAAVGFIDSTGLRLLLRMQLLTEGAASRLVLSRPSLAVRRLLEVTGLTDQFEYLDSETRRTSWCPVCGRELVPTLHTCPHCATAL